jgi:hypothetical protein
MVFNNGPDTSFEDMQVWEELWRREQYGSLHNKWWALMDATLMEYISFM